MDRYEVRQYKNGFAVFQQNQLISVKETQRDALDLITRLTTKATNQEWFVAFAEKGNREKLQNLLEDGWEPYAVDSRLHYLKKAAGGA